MTFIIPSTIKKTQCDDRSFEIEVINSSQIEVCTGKYLLYFYNVNNNQKPLFGSYLTLSLSRKCCYSISLLKNYWSFFYWHHKKTTRTRKACMLGSKRPKQREGTTWLPQSSTYPKSKSDWTGLEHQTLPKTHKTHFMVFTNSPLWSCCIQRLETPKS